MEVSRLSSDLKYVEINGVTINLEERCRIDLACEQLSADINEGSIYFWGKIIGKSSTTKEVCERYLRLPNSKTVENNACVLP